VLCSTAWGDCIMGKATQTKGAKEQTAFSREVREKAARKLKARRHAAHGIWFGLGMMGLIGWSVVVPTLLGAGLGIWLDNRHPAGFSWTLTLLVIGLALGCVNAWHWVAKEDREMREEQENDDA
jgi:ATP synthase protein I